MVLQRGAVTGALEGRLFARMSGRVWSWKTILNLSRQTRNACLGVQCLGTQAPHYAPCPVALTRNGKLRKHSGTQAMYMLKTVALQLHCTAFQCVLQNIEAPGVPGTRVQ
jgi:hypothetical protein